MHTAMKYGGIDKMMIIGTIRQEKRVKKRQLVMKKRKYRI